MNAESIRYWMVVLKKNVYVQLGVTGICAFIAMGSAVLFKGNQYQGFLFVFGVAGAILGIASCYLSAIAYDKLNAKLRGAESAERKEKQKEEKQAKKQKSQKKEA